MGEGGGECWSQHARHACQLPISQTHTRRGEGKDKIWDGGKHMLRWDKWVWGLTSSAMCTSRSHTSQRGLPQPSSKIGCCSVPCGRCSCMPSVEMSSVKCGDFHTCPTEGLCCSSLPCGQCYCVLCVVWSVLVWSVLVWCVAHVDRGWTYQCVWNGLHFF